MLTLNPLEDIHEIYNQVMFCFILENNSSMNDLFSIDKNKNGDKNEILEELINNMDI